MNQRLSISDLRKLITLQLHHNCACFWNGVCLPGVPEHFRSCIHRPSLPSMAAIAFWERSVPGKVETQLDFSIGYEFNERSVPGRGPIESAYYQCLQTEASESSCYNATGYKDPGPRGRTSVLSINKALMETSITWLLAASRLGEKDVQPKVTQR